jgi:parallel beta-helix repeat protein
MKQFFTQRQYPVGNFSAVSASVQSKAKVSLLLIFTVALLLSSRAFAQTPVFFKSGGISPITSGLFLNSTTSNKIQELYAPADFSNTPISGNITRIYFRGSTASTTGTYTNFKVFMGQSATPVFPGTGGTTFFTNLTQVVNSPSKTLTSNATAGGWFFIDLDTPFNYNNSQTLVIEVQFTSFTGGISTWASSSPAAPNHKKIYSTLVTATTGSAHAAYWQDFGMDVVPNTPCTTPPVAGQATSSATTICPNTTFTLRLTNSAVGSGLTYQWQTSANGTTGWTNISGATNSTLTTSQTTTNYYRAQVTCSGQTTSSSSVQINTSAIPVTGTFTINKNAPASATNFISFASAIASMECSGVGGPVIFNVISNSGIYSEIVTIPNIPGTSATNTVTINGNGNTLKGNLATADAVLKLDGAKFIRINNLNVETEATATANSALRLVNDASNNIISNSTISHNTSSTATSYALYIYTGSSNNTFQNNTIIGGYYGIYNYGTATAPLMNNQFIGNTIKDQYTYGIYIYYATNTRMEGNNISRPTRTNVGSFYGITVGTSTGSIITKNRIHNSHGAATSLTGLVYAITISGADAPVGSENVISNNLIYNINSTGTIYALYSTASDGSHFFHNTVNLDNTANNSIVRGFFQTTAATNVKFINNIVSIVGGTTGVKHALYFGATTSTITSNNNVLYLTGGATGSGIGYFSANAPTLTDWKAINSSAYDQNSVSANPQFSNVTTGDLTPTNSAVNNVGQGGTGVTTDINGLIRNATAPDAGAYEFLNNPNDVGVSAITTPNSVCGLTNQETVTIIVTNFGTNSQSNIPVNYTINGGTPVTAVIPGPLAAGAIITYSFATKANLSATGAYTIVASTSLSTDSEASNNSFTKQVSNSSFNTLPITLNFETPATGSGTLRSVTRTNSAISEGTAASQGTGSTKGLIMEGVTNTGWILPAGATDPWSVNQNNFSAVYLCFSTGGNTTDPLWLSFDLKQLFKTANANTNFRITVNGTQIGATYRPPFSGTPINWQKIYVDLGAYRSATSIQIGFESSVAEGYANGAGTANLIDNIRIQRLNPSGVNADVLNSQLHVFPNPSNGIFNVSLPQGKAFEMEVTDLTGRVVMKDTSAAKNTQLDLSQAAKGIYLLKVTSEGSAAVRKLIVE